MVDLIDIFSVLTFIFMKKKRCSGDFEEEGHGFGEWTIEILILDV